VLSGRFSPMLLSEERKMRNRLVCCISGGLLGFALSGTISNALGLTGTAGAVFSVVAGLALGYVVSTLIDVFTAKPDGLLPGRPD
jgi:fructose-specific phosphotransferase system IIC component